MSMQSFLCDKWQSLSSIFSALLGIFFGGDLQFRTPPLPGCWILFLCTFYAEYVHPLHFFLFFCRCNIDPGWCRLLSLFSAVTAKRSLHSLAFCLFPKVNYSLILFQLLSFWIFSAFVYRLILLSSPTTELKFKAKSEIIPIALNYHAIFGIVVLYNYFIVFSLLSNRLPAVSTWFYLNTET